MVGIDKAGTQIPMTHRMTQADVERAGTRLDDRCWGELARHYGYEYNPAEEPQKPPQPAEQPIGTEDDSIPPWMASA